MRILICDDERAFADEVASCVRRHFEANGFEAAYDVCTDSAAVFRSPARYDVAFLDIEMQPHNGLELARRLQEVNPKIILFMITAHNQYLDDALDLRVMRYLQKPLDPVRLTAGLDKVIERMRQEPCCVVLEDNGERVRIDAQDIVYIEIVGRHTMVVTTNKSYRSGDSIRTWSSRLPRTVFVMPHASFLINAAHVTRYARDAVTLCGKYTVPVSYRKQSAFRKFFIAYTRSI